MIVSNTNKQLYENLFYNADRLLAEWKLNSAGTQVSHQTIGDSLEIRTITNLREYFKYLPVIIKTAQLAQNQGVAYNYESWQYYTMLPLDEDLLVVNANTRKISVPSAWKTIGVAGDAFAETVFFKIDRYFDATDFASKSLTPIIEWHVGNQAEGISPAYTTEFVREEDSLLIGWVLTREILEYPGTLEFALRFIKTITEEGEGIKVEDIDYSFSTLPAQMTISKGLNQYVDSDGIDNAGGVETPDSLLNNIYNRIISMEPSEDSYGKMMPPKWEFNVADNDNTHIYNLNGLTEAYYADLDENNQVSIKLDVSLQNGVNDTYAKYIWKKNENGTWGRGLSSGTENAETLDGYTHTFVETTAGSLIGQYRCEVQELVDGAIPRAKTSSQDLWILGPQIPQVKTTNGESEYISAYLSSDKGEVDLVSVSEKSGYIKDEFGAKENTELKVIWSYSDILDPDKASEEAEKAITEKYTVDKEGYYFGTVKAIRNNRLEYSSNKTTYRVSSSIEALTDSNIKWIYANDPDAPEGTNLPSGHLTGKPGDTIVLDITNGYKCDQIAYYWFYTSDSNLNNFKPLTTEPSYTNKDNIRRIQYTTNATDSAGHYLVMVRPIYNRKAYPADKEDLFTWLNNRTSLSQEEIRGSGYAVFPGTNNSSFKIAK